MSGQWEAGCYVASLADEVGVIGVQFDEGGLAAEFD